MNHGIEVIPLDSHRDNNVKISVKFNYILEVTIRQINSVINLFPHDIIIRKHVQVCLYQQKERDSHTNLNRDLVLLVILVVMIQVGKFICANQIVFFSSL